MRSISSAGSVISGPGGVRRILLPVPGNLIGSRATKVGLAGGSQTNPSCEVSKSRKTQSDTSSSNMQHTTSSSLYRIVREFGDAFEICGRLVAAVLVMIVGIQHRTLAIFGVFLPFLGPGGLTRILKVREPSARADSGAGSTTVQ